jgi:hypothetical protein
LPTISSIGANFASIFCIQEKIFTGIHEGAYPRGVFRPDAEFYRTGGGIFDQADEALRRAGEFGRRWRGDF